MRKKVVGIGYTGRRAEGENGSECECECECLGDASTSLEQAKYAANHNASRRAGTDNMTTPSDQPTTPIA